MELIRNNKWVLFAGILYVSLAAYFIYSDQAYYTLFPLGLLAVYFAIFHLEWTFLAVAFFTPLSINIEEFNDSFGLFLPTEPLLFGLMLLILFYQIRKPIIPKETWKNPIIWAVGFYLFWILVSSITSTNTAVSIKFLLVKLWFIIPLLLFGSKVFQQMKLMKAFLWLFSLGMIIAMLYTLFVHASYRFGEEEGHWVMWPFFKDHTIYGAAVGMVIPIIFGLYFSKKHLPLIQAILLAMMVISVTALFFSYTRAAWLSIIVAIAVWGLIHFKVKFNILAIIGIVAISIVYYSWDAIQIEMGRNKMEHTTEEFGERLQSAANVTTDASNLERINRWSCALEMFYEKPVFGYGPGTYAFEYARFQRPENLTIISTNFGNMGNAHSEYLGPLAEMGLVGMLSILLIVIAIFYKAIKLYQGISNEHYEIKVLLMSIIMSLTTYFFHGILNNYLDTDKASVPVWGMAAMIIAIEIYLTSKSKEKDSSFEPQNQ